MERALYEQMENCMLDAMEGGAHDAEHVYRVLYAALDIAQTEPAADLDVVIAACLLHDIGRAEERQDPSVCHAQVGAEKAYRFLLGIGQDEPFAAHVRDCIRTHRFRSDAPPETLEAKILFDADKLDSAGAFGVARTLVFRGERAEPLYTRAADGSVSDGTGDKRPSFFQEYKRKLERVYAGFYTARGAALAESRRATAEGFYRALLREARETDEKGREILRGLLQ